MVNTKLNEILTALQTNGNLMHEDWFIIIDEIWNQQENKNNFISLLFYITQKNISIQEKRLNKCIVELESAHPLITKTQIGLVNFLPYVRQHTINGKSLDGSCHAFYDYFYKVWLPEAKKELFNDFDWQKRLDCKEFIGNLKDTLKKNGK